MGNKITAIIFLSVILLIAVLILSVKYQPNEGCNRTYVMDSVDGYAGINFGGIDYKVLKCFGRIVFQAVGDESGNLYFQEERITEDGKIYYELEKVIKTSNKK